MLLVHMMQVGMIGRQEFTSGQWNELLQFINSCCNSQVPAQREVHMYIRMYIKL